MGRQHGRRSIRLARVLRQITSLNRIELLGLQMMIAEEIGDNDDDTGVGVREPRVPSKPLQPTAAEAEVIAELEEEDQEATALSLVSSLSESLERWV